MVEKKHQRLDKAIKYLIMEGIVTSQEDVANKMNANKVSITNAIKGNKKYLTDNFIVRFCNVFDVINKSWLLTGDGEMLSDENSRVKSYESKFSQSNKKLIPFYDDVTTTIGGVKGKVANVDERSNPVEYIDTGDWFTDATAAIRHYGESMIEYPEGSILALKEVNERQLIIWGRDYVIETNEYRITKRVQRGKTNDSIRAYSSNTETYPDGQLIHEPLDIYWSDVRSISLVLGYVVKKNGGTMVYASKNK